jgi:hypothetical protein
VVKQVDAAEVRIVVAAVLAAAADAVLVANHLPKLCAHLVTARPVEEIELSRLNFTTPGQIANEL